MVEDARRVKAVEELRNAKQQEQVGWRDSWSTKPGENASAEGEWYETQPMPETVIVKLIIFQYHCSAHAR